MKYYNNNELKLLKERLESDVLFLIVTATDIEQRTVLREMTPLRTESDIIKAAPDRNTYYIGCLGKYPVVHVRTTDQGAIDRDSSIITVGAALDYWDVSAVIMVGIAFGCYPKKQSIGDVLISTSLRNYEDVKIRTSDEEDRSSNPKSGIVLLNRFKNISNWDFTLPTGNKPKILYGEILSGEKLVDNKEFREKLAEKYPMAIGGEMEGYGIYAAAEHHNVREWIVIKAICDFAENKEENKHTNQQIAADSACSCVKSVLSEPVFDSLKKKSKLK